MTNLEPFIREYVSPVMRSTGFKKKGKAFRLTSANGNSAFLQFTENRADVTATVFDITFTIVPLAFWAWVNRNYEELPEMDGSGPLLYAPVIPPQRLVHEIKGTSAFPNRWAFRGDAQREDCGTTLAALLADSAVPRMSALLEEEALLAEIADPTPPVLRLVDRDMGEILLHLDNAPDGYIEERLQRLTGLDHMRSFVSWVNGRTA